MNNPEKLATQAAQDEENKNNRICLGYHYAKANTNNVSKTWALLQTTDDDDEFKIEPNIIFVVSYSITRKIQIL